MLPDVGLAHTGIAGGLPRGEIEPGPGLEGNETARRDGGDTINNPSRPQDQAVIIIVEQNGREAREILASRDGREVHISR